MVYNGILMETIGMSVMISIGLFIVFLAGHAVLLVGDHNKYLSFHRYDSKRTYGTVQ